MGEEALVREISGQDSLDFGGLGDAGEFEFAG